MLHLRPARRDDARAINAVSAHLGYDDLTEQAAESALMTLLNAADNSVTVALIDAQVVGWIHVFHARRLASPAFHEIGGLVVDPAHRRHGVGRALVEHARRHTPGTLRVRCRDDRAETHRFYQALSFTGTKSQRVFEHGNTPDA